MKRRRLLGNKIGIVIVASILILAFLPNLGCAKQRPKIGYFEIQTQDYTIRLDYLPKELNDAMSKGFHLHMHVGAPIKIWNNSLRSFRFRDISYIAVEFVSINISFKTRSPLYIYSYYISGRNILNKVLFYEEASVIYYKANNTMPTSFTQSDSYVNKFRLTWFMNGIDEQNSAGCIKGEGQFYNFRAQTTFKLFSTIFYNSTGVTNKIAEVELF